MRDAKLLISALVLAFVLISMVLIIILKPNDVNVVFMSDDRIIETVKVKKGNAVKRPIDPIKEEYSFVDWYYEDEAYNFNNKVKKNITLIAKWESKNGEVKKVNVVFDSNGGNDIESVETEIGNVISKPSDPVKDGYEFISWQLDNEDFDFDTKITENITLTAKWKQSTYIVSFNSNGGSYVAPQEVAENSSAIKPENPIREGYTFVEWQYDYYKYSFTSKITKDITLTAKWEKNATVEVTYTVTFNSNNGSNVASQKVKENSVATKPVNPTREGYSFIEWQLNDSKYDFNSRINKDITLTAKWEKIENINNDEENNIENN